MWDALPADKTSSLFKVLFVSKPGRDRKWRLPLSQLQGGCVLSMDVGEPGVKGKNSESLLRLPYSPGLATSGVGGFGFLDREREHLAGAPGAAAAKGTGQAQPRALSPHSGMQGCGGLGRQRTRERSPRGAWTRYRNLSSW